jgi:hypothetical protein
MTHQEFLVDTIRELRKKIVVVERELALLDQAQRPTPADMAREITAHPGEPGYIHPECHCVSCDANRASQSAKSGNDNG